MRVLLLGAEIMLFFNTFKEKGLYGIIIASIIIALIIYKVFSIMQNKGIKTYSDFLKSTLCNKNAIIKNVIENIINIFLLISFFVMFVGIITFFIQELKINNMLFSIFIALICFFVLTKNIDGVIKLNTVLIPALIFFIIFIGIKSNSSVVTTINAKNNITKNWILSSLIYVSYNSIVLIPILVTLNGEIKNKKQIKLASIISGAIIGILGVIIYKLLFLAGDEGLKLEMPLIYVAGKLGNSYKLMYGLVILFAIFTSVISSGYAFLQNTTKTKKQYKIICALLCTIAVIVSKIKFSSLVNTLYPVFGYLGLLQIINIITYNTKKP